MLRSQKEFTPESNSSELIFTTLPAEAQQWFENLSWHERRYILSLCHLICVASPETRASFLDDYTADGLVSRMLEDRVTKERVKEQFNTFRVSTELDETLLRAYIKQFYIHSAQDNYRQPDLYLESALRLVLSSEERNHVFNYILGFELFKVMFKMSWLQHERLYRLQRNQDEFIHAYIKPIQHAHKINGIIVPRDKKIFFARRAYYVKQPVISEKKLVQLVMVTFTADIVTNFGFSIIRHAKAFAFDYDYIYNYSDQEIIFS
jgi:hypothetical protein